MLKLHVRKLGTIAILCLQGRMVRGETAALRNVVNSQSDISAVVLDLSQVSMVDAGGLGLILELRQEAQSRGIDLKLMNVNRLVSRVLEITLLNSVFEVTSGTELWSQISRGRPASLMELAPCA